MEYSVKNYLNLATLAMKEHKEEVRKRIACFRKGKSYTPPKRTLKENHLDTGVDQVLFNFLSTSLLVQSVSDKKEPDMITESQNILKALQFYYYTQSILSVSAQVIKEGL